MLTQIQEDKQIGVSVNSKQKCGESLREIQSLHWKRNPHDYHYRNAAVGDLRYSEFINGIGG